MITRLTATPDRLWPPNKKKIGVTIGVTVVDDSDPSPSCHITGVTSNEALDASDWSLNGPLALSLRSERGGSDTGRIYSIAVTCTSASQLSATGSVTVSVPHVRN